MVLKENKENGGAQLENEVHDWLMIGLKDYQFKSSIIIQSHPNLASKFQL